MGATIDFYSADPELLRKSFEIEDLEEQFVAQSSFPRADLGIHLRLPEDLDRLLQGMRHLRIDVPESFDELCIAEIWNDGDEGSAWLHLLSDDIKSFGATDDSDLEKLTLGWVGEFEAGPDAARVALRELRSVCKHSQEAGTSVLVFLCY